MSPRLTFQRRGIVEGFFGPPWSVAHRAAIFEFGAKRGMNTYLYAPKDDPYHRERWREPYPDKEWGELLKLIRLAQKHRIDFVYGFHPGKGLRFGAEEPVQQLIGKAQRFYDAGVRTFAILFDDIPSHLERDDDRRIFDGSLARAEAVWLKRILERQPAAWSDVEWWMCPSYYTEDPLLARMFGAFEPRFLETLAEHLPQEVACFWTGPAVVSKKITSAHARKIAGRVKRPLILWDNYPVNDLSMSDEMHLSPLTGRDSRLPEAVYGYLNNPLLQEELSFIPLGTCFDYAANPPAYDPEQSWESTIRERFGAEALAYWRAIRKFCERTKERADKPRAMACSSAERAALEAAHRYLMSRQDERWCSELRPWIEVMESSLKDNRP
jgi:hyaluronoglucosaminidase